MSWLYKILARDVRWGSDPILLRLYSRRISLLVFVLIAVAIFFSWLNDLTWGFWLIGGAGAFLFAAVDVAAVAFGVMATQFQDTRLDLVRVTPINPAMYIEAQWQMAQVQAWRILVIMQAIRFTIVAAALIFGIFLVVMLILFTFGFGVLWVLSMLALALMEPMWRLQAMTAVGIFAGMRGQSTYMRWLIGLGVMFAIWLAQGAIALIPISVLNMTYDWTPVAVSLTFVLPMMTLIIRFVQLRIRDWCLDRAAALFLGET